MNNNPRAFGARIFIISAVTLLLMLGCASAPEEPQVKKAPASSEVWGSEAPAPEPVEPPPPAPEPTPVVVRPDYPERYVVVKGDTLWDIAARFLRDPWLWPEVWHINPEIRNPHLIYPGDVIVMYFVDGRPVITLEQAPAGIPTVKLAPEIRSMPIEQAVATIPMDKIGPFLSNHRVVSKEELDAAPYIVSSLEEHLVTGPGDRIYVRGLEKEPEPSYNIVRPGEPYVNPDDENDILGYEAVFVGDAFLARAGDPATLDIGDARREAVTGDRLLPVEQRTIDPYFTPHAPQDPVNGRILAVMDGVRNIGQYAVVVVSLGEQQGMKPGTVLAVWQSGREVRDVVQGSRARVQLPEERAGFLMVFRTFDRVSYALVMRATRSLRLQDRVTNP